MFKKLLPFIIILLFAIPIGLFYYFFKDKTIPDNRIDALETVPIDAVMIVEARSVTSLIQLFNTQEQIRNKLNLVKGLKPFLKGFSELDSLLVKDKTIADKLVQTPGVWSLHQTGDRQYDFLLVLQSNNRLNPKEIRSIITKVTGVGCETKERTYNHTKITELSFSSSIIDKLHLAVIKKYAILSTSPILVEEVIRQVKSGNSLNQLSEFGKARAVAGQNADANVYFNIKRFSLMLRKVLNPGISKYIGSFSRYGSWMELDLNFKQDMLVSNGFAFSGDTLAWLDVFRDQSPQKNQLDEILPPNTLGFMSFGIEKPDEFFKELDKIYKGTDLETRRNNNYTKLCRSLGEDLRLAFSEIVSQEAGLAWLPGRKGEVMPVVVINTPSRKLASDRLNTWLRIRARNEGKRIQDYRYTYSIDKGNRHFIYKMPIQGIPEALFGSLFSDVKGKYFGFAGNYLVIAEDRKAIQDILYYKALNKTLSTDRVYKSVLEQISSRNNFLAYMAPFRSASLLSDKASSEWKKYISSNEGFLQQIGAVSLQVQARNGNYYHTAFIKFADSQIDGPQTVWDSRLDTTLNFKPVLTINHQTHAKEIVVQDENNTLYLINTSGRVLWKVRLNEAINSQIYQIDYYKNKKLQLLFSTQNALHLIDRNGNYVDKYPIKLRAPASNGMALFDYEKNKDYRIFIACTDKKVYAYNKGGSIINGWKFSGSEGVIKQAVQHFRIGTKDYIVFADEMRVYILDRRGNIRVRPKRQFAKSANNKLILDAQTSSKGPRLVTTDVEGKLWFTYFTGEVESKKVGSFSAGHFFQYQDIDLDGRKDYIFADQKRLEVFGSDGKKIFSKKLESKISHPPAIYTFPGNRKEIGVVCRDDEQIYLFLPDGKLHQGFPLVGRTPFTIGYLDRSSKKFNLLVGGDDLFLYNYRVE